MTVDQRFVLSDPVFRYIETVEPLHEQLRQLLTQVAGYSLVVMGRDKPPVFLDGPVAQARDAFAPLRAALAAVRVPERARHHHRHMVLASEALQRSLDCLTVCLGRRADDPARDMLSRTLKATAGHLRFATRALPGFEMVDLSQACCAFHAGSARPICEPVSVQG